MGGGSYTCISFGEPRAPIFAFHTLQDANNRVFVGTNSGFEDGFVEKLRNGVRGLEDSALSLNSVETIRRKRKLLKQIQQKEEERVEKERRMRALVRQSRKVPVMPPAHLPLTSYQRVKRKLAQATMEEREVQLYEYPVQP